MDKTQVTDKVFQYIDEFAKTLGVTADRVFESVVKQMYVDAAISGLEFIVFGIALFVVVRFMINYNKKFNERKEKVRETSGYWSDSNDDQRFKINLAYTVSIIFLGFVVLWNAEMGISKAVNPEYYATKEIVKQIQGK
ncbi:hypothetical protein JANET_264 [Bacillus phage Janet]|nr:hypothetical protein JANET_264 [Bacillus phage Janet]